MRSVRILACELGERHSSTSGDRTAAAAERDGVEKQSAKGIKSSASVGVGFLATL